jgi:hypothetical protein
MVASAVNTNPAKANAVLVIWPKLIDRFFTSLLLLIPSDQFTVAIRCNSDPAQLDIFLVLK